MTNKINYRAGLICRILRVMLFSAAAVLPAGSALAGPVAEDLSALSIEELMEVRVVSASRFEQKGSEAPASVTVITASDIRRFGYHSLSEILNSVRGVYMTYDRTYHYAGIRGFNRPADYNTRFLLLIDGIRINDNIFDQAPAGTDLPLDPDLIDRVEIIRGPSSSLYGTNAFFGVINIITRDLKTGGIAEVAGEAASQGTYRGRLTAGAVSKTGAELLVSGTSLISGGARNLYFREFDSDQDRHGSAEKNDAEEAGSAFIKARYSAFSFEAVYGRRKKTVPTAPFGTIFNDPEMKITDERLFLDLQHEHKTTDNLTVVSRIFHGMYNYDGSFPYTPSPDTERILNRDSARGRWWGAEVLLNYRFRGHRLISGLAYTDNYRQDQQNYDPGIVYFRDRRQSENWAVYAQIEVTLRKNLLLNLGVRHDRYHTFGGTTNPRTALIYNPVEGTTLKLLYGRAFRAPNPFELYYNDLQSTRTQKPGLSLRPEIINTYEAVLEQNLGKHARCSVSAYSYRVHDLIAQMIDTDGLIVFHNMEQVRAKGIEAELQAKSENGIQGRLSYAYQDARDGSTGARLTNSPMHIAKFGLTAPVISNSLQAGFETYYTGRRQTLAGNFTGDSFISNINISSSGIAKGLELSAGIFNILDRQESQPGGPELLQDSIRQDGRTFRMQVKYRF